MRIKDLYKGDRPREKLIKYGASRLSTSELLAIIIGTGVKDHNVLEVSKKVISSFFLKDYENINIKDLINIKGVGIMNVCRILACLEFSKRIFNKTVDKIIYSPENIWDNLKDVRNSRKEHFYVFCLDSRNQIIKRELISIGILNASIVHPREVFEPAIRNLAAQIILSHNHPSQDVNPSEEDIALTKRLVEAGKLLGIDIIDHVIVSKDKYFSMKKQGLI
jgi:DNA repair protein RadC